MLVIAGEIPEIEDAIVSSPDDKPPIMTKSQMSQAISDGWVAASLPSMAI